jgi:hypothetical protein
VVEEADLQGDTESPSIPTGTSSLLMFAIAHSQMSTGQALNDDQTAYLLSRA